MKTSDFLISLLFELLEEVVREQGYVKEGENPVVVIPPEESSGEEGVQKEGFLTSLLGKIKSLLARVIQW